MSLSLLVPILFGAVIGGLLGRFGGCTGGACPLLASPWRGMLYGATLGLLIALAERYR
jgi:hypothetical protein